MSHLTDTQVDQVLARYPDLIRDAVLEALVEHGAGLVRQSKTSLRKKEAGPASDRLTSMMGFIGNPPRVVGFKLIGSASGNPAIGLPRASVLIILCESETHALRHIIAGTSISLQRTAEMAVLGIQRLKPGARKVVIVGNGELARALVPCIRNRITRVEDVTIYGRVELARLDGAVSIPADIVITATSADVPILTDVHLKDVRLVVNLGLRELSSATIAAFDEHIVDDLRSCASQTTPFAEALRSQSIMLADVRQLSAIMNAPSQTSPEKRIYFQPSGMVAIDLLAAAKVLDYSSRL